MVLAGYKCIQSHLNLDITRSKEGNVIGQFGPRQNNKTIGERSEAIIMAKLLEVGYGVLMPFGDNRQLRSCD